MFLVKPCPRLNTPALSQASGHTALWSAAACAIWPETDLSDANDELHSGQDTAVGSSLGEKGLTPKAVGAV